MNIYVGGANASGKSTILRELQRMEPSIKVVHGTSLLMEERGITLGDYDAIRSISQDELHADYGRAMKKLLKTPTHVPRIVDSHYLYIRHGAVSVTTDDWLAAFDAAVLLYADTETTWRRIRHDHDTRDRAIFPAGLTEQQELALLNRYLLWTKAAFEKLTERYQLPRLFIDNSARTPHESARVLLGFIKMQEEFAARRPK